MSAVNLAARLHSAGSHRSGAARAVGTFLRLGPQRLGLGLALVCLLGSGCAYRPQATPAATAPQGPSSHSEIIELEKTIRDNKALLRGGSERGTTSAPSAAEQASPLSAGTPPASRCDGVCRAAQEICTASRRICQISLDLADNAVTASCQRSERACTEAGALCGQCR